jgi:hypothetical protein
MTRCSSRHTAGTKQGCKVQRTDSHRSLDRHVYQVWPHEAHTRQWTSGTSSMSALFVLPFVVLMLAECSCLRAFYTCRNHWEMCLCVVWVVVRQFFGFSDPVTIALIQRMPGYDVLASANNSTV